MSYKIECIKSNEHNKKGEFIISETDPYKEGMLPHIMVKNGFWEITEIKESTK